MNVTLWPQVWRGGAALWRSTRLLPSLSSYTTLQEKIWVTFPTPCSEMPLGPENWQLLDRKSLRAHPRSLEPGR